MLERNAAERRKEAQRVRAAQRAWEERWKPGLYGEDVEVDAEMGDAAELLSARPRSRDAAFGQRVGGE